MKNNLFFSFLLKIPFIFIVAHRYGVTGSVITTALLLKKIQNEVHGAAIPQSIRVSSLLPSPFLGDASHLEARVDGATPQGEEPEIPEGTLHPLGRVT